MSSFQSSSAAASTAIPGTASPHHSSRTNPVFLVFGCTLFAAAAQVLMKYGALHPMPGIHLDDPASAIRFLMAVLGNSPLLLGYSLHACNAFLLIMALRHGELSVLFPVYALSYIWVDLLSLYFFHEHMNVWKTAGIVLVMGGVALLGRVSTRA
jgi:drug/metabolite transporter (DMT)-like permease